ncbi:uroporphyrinogen-III C-methyltransferase [Marinobacter nanhaiticus D15-8W]|nr:uroporphyrinogen-III C-methyltransferase [Marinobacter nanhaiticus]BES69613.1 uroporphyrinogen-III C-methyltransferase [Marinobacter nanhaiticus D15-8W]
MTESKNNLPATVPPSSSQPRRLWPLWLLIVITLAALVLMGLWSWHQWQQQQSLRQTISHLQSTTDSLDRNYSQTGSQLDSRLQSLQGELNEQQQLVADMRRQIDHNAQALLDAGNRDRTDWLLAEAEYLLRIANQRLQVEQDIDGALSALQAADEVLNETDDPGTYPVRKQVAKEIMALRSIEDVDQTGLYLELEAAIDAINNLTDEALAALDTSTENDESATRENPGEEGNTLARGWSQIKSTLNEAIAIRRLDEPVKPLLSPQQSVYARLNMRLMLEEAQLALLRGNQTLYERALTKARDWLDTWYDGSHAPVRALRERLAELSQMDINPQLPDVSQSLNLLKARLEGRLNATSGETTPTGNSNNSASPNSSPSQSSESAPSGDKAGDAS